jgi:biotin synthase-related radical SAM superfamily protein
MIICNIEHLTKMIITNAEIKAELLAVGTVDIDRSLLGRVTIPTAGPGAGGTAFFLRWDEHRVRLGVDENSPLKAIEDNDHILILKNNEPLLRAKLEEELIHCPQQAYITISEQCIFDCKYCPVPKLSGKIKSTREIVELVEKANESQNFKAISITSGVAGSPEKEVDRALDAVNSLKQFNVPIGVSVYPTADSSQRLKEAGVLEVKYNVETMDRELFGRVCPGMSLDFALGHLEDAIRIFGKNRVFSNFIIGLGETDRTVEAGLKELVLMGVIPIIRAASMHPLRKGEVYIKRPDAKRLLRLNRALRSLLDEYGLRADIARTMCLPCMGCDLNPHRDL